MALAPGASTKSSPKQELTPFELSRYLEDLIQKAKSVSDPAERTRLYEEAQTVFKDEAPWVTIAHSIVFKPIRKEVSDFKIDPFGGHVFYGVDIQE